MRHREIQTVIVEPLIDILDTLDACADTDQYRILQIQLSRIALYNLGKAGWDREKLSACKYLALLRWNSFIQARKTRTPP